MHSAHGLIGNGVPEILERSSHAVISPVGILLGHANHQCCDFSSEAWSAGVGPMLGTIELVRDELTIPAEDCVRLGNGRDLF